VTGAEKVPLPFENLVTAAYEPIIRRQLEDAERWATLFPRTAEDEYAAERREREEQDRRVSLMKDHMNAAGTTSECRCGHVGYSTPGYLLHLYEVIAADVDPDER